MNKIAVLAASSLLAAGVSTATYAVATSTAEPQPSAPHRAVLDTTPSGITSPSFVRTSAGVRPVKPKPSHDVKDDHGGARATLAPEPGDDHGGARATLAPEPGDDHGGGRPGGDDHGGDGHRGHGSDD